jgi:hypothetical protein
MKKILTVLLQKFRNEAHLEYMILFRKLIQKFPNIQTLIVTLYMEFSNLVDQEEQLINTMRKSDYTQQITEAAQRVDRAIIGMHEAIRSHLYHFDLAVVAAAQSINNRFDAFGDITRKSYGEETAVVNLLINDLNSTDYSAKVTLLGLTAWLTELQNAEVVFEQLIALRATEAANKPQGKIKNIRKKIDILFHKVIALIAAADTIDDTGAYEQFINELNVETTYFNTHTHQHAKKDIGVADHCFVYSIADQYCTDKAITPIPKVIYREEGKPDVELTFAKDFFVTYKNNIEVGTADIILHGKGAFKGRKRVTFNIIPEETI